MSVADIRKSIAGNVQSYVINALKNAGECREWRLKVNAGPETCIYLLLAAVNRLRVFNQSGAGAIHLLWQGFLFGKYRIHFYYVTQIILL
jgi:hypothetical protein